MRIIQVHHLGNCFVGIGIAEETGTIFFKTLKEAETWLRDNFNTNADPYYANEEFTVSIVTLKKYNKEQACRMLNNDYCYWSKEEAKYLYTVLENGKLQKRKL